MEKQTSKTLLSINIVQIKIWTAFSRCSHTATSPRRTSRAADWRGRGRWPAGLVSESLRRSML